MFYYSNNQKGSSLLDVVVGTAILLIVFLGIFGAFKLSVSLVTSNKLKTGGLALVSERIEYIRSLQYSDIGTVGGIPQGSLEAEEIIVFNNVNYTRRTFVQYVDDSADGSGANDVNSITADYKTVKVTVSWIFRNSTRSVSLVTNIIPKGIESISGGGTLSVSVLNAVSVNVPSANVSIVNTNVNPSIGFSTFTNTSGVASFPGAPAGSGYEITITKSGYSSAQTYDVTSSNIDPSPGHLTVGDGQTTTGTFSIDVLGSLIVRSFEVIKSASWEDFFADLSQIASSQNTVLSNSAIELQSSETGYSSSGSVSSVTLSPSYLSEWTTLSWNDVTSADTGVRYSLYYGAGILIPDSDLSGNQVGFISSPVDISGLSTSTYSGVYIVGTLTSSNTLSTPSILDWRLDYKVGPTPIQNIVMSLTGAKTIGADASGNPLYKYSSSIDTGASSQTTIGSLEWDNYTLAIDDNVVGYDIAQTCALSPFALSPAENKTVDVLLAENQTNSLHLAVKDTSGALLEGATARLYDGGSYDTTQKTSSCGQSFFNDGLLSGTYSIDVSLVGYQSKTVSNISVSDDSALIVTLNSL
ncbi:MAG TPA: carboxypeptidase regulatory-like domain-containing protein [Candidatus Kaiserbacteria bacterium]|mgnify:CR=1 FL=1|nr:carboxypeptidase regulatory-like domain-containing protein [Candidatus Kaiserbacteria bacterium]